MAVSVDEKVFLRWFQQAVRDLDAGKVLLNEGFFPETAFFSHQAVEKALKAFHIKKEGSLIRVHDSSFLAKKLGLPSELVGFCEDLDPLYVESRYPDAGERDVEEAEACELLENAEKVVEWVKKKL